MKACSLTTFVIALAILHVGSCVQYFEFGEDQPYTQVISNVQGSMGLFQKTKVINLEVPYCNRVTYVKVGVSNLLSTPKVDFDKNTNSVTIEYKFLASELSRYTITAKGYRDPNCA